MHTIDITETTSRTDIWTQRRYEATTPLALPNGGGGVTKEHKQRTQIKLLLTEW